jgi:hypothetical protein
MRFGRANFEDALHQFGSRAVAGLRFIGQNFRSTRTQRYDNLVGYITEEKTETIGLLADAARRCPELDRDFVGTLTASNKEAKPGYSLLAPGAPDPSWNILRLQEAYLAAAINRCPTETSSSEIYQQDRAWRMLCASGISLEELK